MRDIRQHFADYAEYHRTPGNKVCHRVGIPLIMFSLIGLLARVAILREPVRVDAAIVLIAIATIFYFTLEWKLALVMLLFSAGFYVLGLATPVGVHAGLFVFGWILQFVGHGVYEKRQPAFLTNLVHLLVGPLWILNDAIPVVRLKSSS